MVILDAEPDLLDKGNDFGGCGSKLGVSEPLILHVACNVAFHVLGDFQLEGLLKATTGLCRLNDVVLFPFQAFDFALQLSQLSSQCLINK
mgnify:CR=1 FL=1